MIASNQTPLRGRPFDTRLGEDLAVLCALSREGAQASARDISALLGVDGARAAEILRCLAAGGVTRDDEENLGPMLALYGLGERGSMSRVAVASARHTMELRLTGAQAEAASQAFDRLGLSATSDLRRRIEQAFFPVGWKRETTGVKEDDPGALPGLLACARSQVTAITNPDDATLVTQQVVTFVYQGSNDQFARTRRIAPRSCRMAEGHWVVDAFDLDALAPRSFLACRMEDPRLADELVQIPRIAAQNPDWGTVCLRCTGTAQARVRAWEGAREISREGDAALIEVPYYRGDWLPRHVLALGKHVSYNNPELEAAVREVAVDDLRRARRFRP